VQPVIILEIMLLSSNLYPFIANFSLKKRKTYIASQLSSAEGAGWQLYHICPEIWWFWYHICPEIWWFWFVL